MNIYNIIGLTIFCLSGLIFIKGLWTLGFIVAGFGLIFILIASDDTCV